MKFLILSNPLRKTSSLLLLPLLLVGGCAPSVKDVVGTYADGKDADDETVVIRADRTFSKELNHREIATGTWKLNGHFLDTGIELDSKTDASEFRLTSWHGKFCWEVQRDFDYWCRIKS